GEHGAGTQAVHWPMATTWWAFDPPPLNGMFGVGKCAGNYSALGTTDDGIAAQLIRCDVRLAQPHLLSPAWIPAGRGRLFIPQQTSPRCCLFPRKQTNLGQHGTCGGSVSLRRASWTVDWL